MAGDSDRKFRQEFSPSAKKIPLLRRLKITHFKLEEKYSWYYSWHKNPYAGLVHSLVLTLIVVFSSVVSLSAYYGLMLESHIENIPEAQAATSYYWVGADTSWNTATNWSLSEGGPGNGAVPVAGDTAIFTDADATNCTLDADVSVAAITNSSALGLYVGTFDAATYDVTLTGTMTFQGGTLNLGTLTTWSLGSSAVLWRVDGTTLNCGTSTIITTGTSGSTNFYGGQGFTYYNLTVSGNYLRMGSNDASRNINISNNLTIDSGKVLNLAWSGSSVAVLNGATISLSGTFQGYGTLYLYDSACATLSDTGTVNSKINFYAATGDISIVARTIGKGSDTGAVGIINSHASSSFTATLGAGTFTIPANFIVSANGTGNMTIDADANDPTVNVAALVTASGTGAGSEYITNGTSTWTALSRYWVGASTSWNTAGNWAPHWDGPGGAGVPGATNTAYFTSRDITDCTLDANVSVTAIINTASALYTGTPYSAVGVYTGIFDADTRDVTTSAQFFWGSGAGVLYMGSGTWTINRFNVKNMAAGNFFSETSTLIFNGTGTRWNAVADAKTLYNVTIPSNTNIDDSGGFRVSHNFTISAGATFSSANWGKVIVSSGASLVIDGTLSFNPTYAANGYGLFLEDDAGAALPSTGTLNCLVAFQTVTKSISIPDRTYGSLVWILNATGSNYTATMESGTFNIGGPFLVKANGAGNMTVDAAVNDPTVNLTDTTTGIDYTGTGGGSESLLMGDGTWTVAGSVDFSLGSVTANASTLVMTGTGRTLTTNAVTLNNLTLSNSTAVAQSLIISGNLNLAGNLSVATTGTGGETLDCSTNDPAVAITGNISMSKSSTGVPSISMGEGNTWTVSGNVNFTNGTVTASTSSLTLNSTTAGQTLTSASQSLNNLTVTNSHADGVTFADSATVTGTFTDTTALSKLTFADAATFTFAVININGSGAGNVVMTKGAGAHGHFHFIVPGAPAVTYVTVDNSDATGSGAPIDATSHCTNGLGNTNWNFGGTAPVNDSLTFTNPYASNIAVADDTTSWNFQAKVTDVDGPTNINYIEIGFANSADSTIPYDSLKYRYTEATDTFSEVADTQGAGTITSVVGDAVAVGNQWTVNFKIKLNNNFLAKDTNYNIEIYSIDDLSLSDDDDYANKYQVTTLSLTLDTDFDTIAFGNLLPGSVITGTTITTVTTNYPNGYSLAASDGVVGADSALLHSDTSTRIADYAGTIGTPTVWSGTGLGICVYIATNKDTSKWGAGVSETDILNKYAGVPETATIMNSKTGSPTSGDTASIGYKLVVPNSQKTGAYSGIITYTATGVLL